MNKFYMSVVGLVVAASSILLFNFLGTQADAALPRDCDTNSIINCGGITAKELATRYNENKTGDLKQIYADYGLSATDMTHADTRAKMGEVHKDGRVTVGGVTVATDAQSIGRHNTPGSHVRLINGQKYYERANTSAFLSESIAAYVFFDENGDFRAAVLTSCGNPVTAKKPVYKCESLSKSKITRTKYSFDAVASASNGATIAEYSFDFGDGKKSTSAAKSVEHDYVKAGTYTVTVTVTAKVNGKIKTAPAVAACQVKVTVEELPVTPTATCDLLTATKITRLDYTFTGKATVTGGATIVSYTFDFGEGTPQTVPSPTDVKHSYTKEGTYTAKLTVTAKVNNVNKPITNTNCTAKIVVTSLNECKPGIPVGDKRCEEKPECKPSIPVGDERCTDKPTECKPGIPTGDERCTPCDVPGKETLPKNSPECVEVVTPPELPKTGPMDMFFGTMGLGSMAGAAYYYVGSRRGLLAELLKR